MKNCLILALACFTGVASAQTVAALSQTHQADSASLATRRDAEIDRLRQPYLAALVEADQAATKTGNTEMLRAIEQERDAVKTGKLRMELPEALPRKLSPVRRALLTGEQRARLAFDKQQQAINAGYLQKLGALQLRAASDPALAEQIAKEKARVLAGIRGPITDLQSGLPGTQWRLFAGEGYQSLKFGKDGKVNGNWMYEITARDKVSVIWDKSSSMTLTLAKDGSTLSAGDKIWALERE
ncbi:MAG: hypothetical protein KDN04_00500 [Verrucomicrobiae bacterium]|nr:hypothetical protein [Verrucomicrobiae bacterium]